jgi:hypothetical protein
MRVLETTVIRPENFYEQEPARWHRF